MSQLATMINYLQVKVEGRLLSQPKVNPKNVSAMILRTGKEIEVPKLISLKDKSEEHIEKEIEEEG